jgi:signal transduction histidine kinase/ActR/RegA family two-component response regulator
MEGRLLSETLPGAKRPGGLIERHGRIIESGRTQDYVLDYDADGIRGLFANTVAPFGRYVAVSFRDITSEMEEVDALAAAKAEAERASEAKSKFLAAASHDLRQPVQSLTLLLAMIKRQVADRPKAAASVEMAETALNSLSGLLTGILDISRLEAGVVTPHMASVDLASTVEKLAAEYEPRARAAGMELRLKTRATPPARADAALLDRILRNLLENALRYTARGGILIGLRQRGDMARIDVIDTGIGIPEEKQAEIFVEFRQLGNPARDASQGLGLGLAIVDRLAHLLDARVEVRSRPGRGSRFSLALPLDRAAVVEEDSAAQQPTAALLDPGGRVLLIEDNASLREAFAAMLGEWGYDAIAAASGEEAFARAANEDWRFDAILADHRLGAGVTGAEAAREIARRAGRAFPTMIVTGDTAKERIAEIHASGFDMMHKPVEAGDLRRRLAQVLTSASADA